MIGRRNVVPGLALIELRVVIAILASLPALGFLALFYALAVHMHLSLGTRPGYIGTSGFPPALRMHSEAAVFACNLLIRSLIFLPLPLMACYFVPRWRRFVPYLAIFGVSVLFTFILMQFAPPAFLTWWWD